MLDNHIEMRRDMRAKAIAFKSTGMFLNEDGSTLYLVNGREVSQDEFGKSSGLGHLSAIGFLRNGQEREAREFDKRRRAIAVESVTWKTSIPFSNNKWMIWRTLLKANCIALAIRLALRLGYIIVIIGKCRSGKTMILERSLPNQILNRKEDLLASENQNQILCLRKLSIPVGYFAIDEFSYLDDQTLLQDLEKLNGRHFAIAIQSRADLDKNRVRHWFEARRRLEIILERY